MKTGNIFDNVPLKAENEIFEDLLTTHSFRIERIISTGQSSPPGEWFDQENDEWVLLLKGCAEILYEGDKGTIKMIEGSYLFIPAHQKHRVESTSPDEPTIWLALHFKPKE
jgi:cupin 2 domain-containing protein